MSTLDNYIYNMFIYLQELPNVCQKMSLKNLYIMNIHALHTNRINKSNSKLIHCIKLHILYIQQAHNYKEHVIVIKNARVRLVCLVIKNKITKKRKNPQNNKNCYSYSIIFEIQICALRCYWSFVLFAELYVKLREHRLQRIIKILFTLGCIFYSRGQQMQHIVEHWDQLQKEVVCKLFLKRRQIWFVMTAKECTDLK